MMLPKAENSSDNLRVLFRNMQVNAKVVSWKR